MSLTAVRAHIVKHHKYAWMLTVLSLFIVSGVYLHNKLADAATFTFTQSSATGGWATLSADTATHAAGNGSNWSKYSAATGVTASASGVSLEPSSYTATDDGAFSTSTISGSGTSLATQIPNGGTGADGALDLASGCSGTGMTWSSPTCTINTGTKSVFNFTTINIPTGTTLTATGAKYLTLYVTGAVTVSGNISLSGGDGTAGRYLGGGISGVGTSGAGAITTIITTVHGADSYTSGGSAGQKGNSNSGCESTGGGGGGGGGGSLVILSNSITINSGGYVKSNGGTGGQGSVLNSGGGGSGGSGGRVILISNSIINNGSIEAKGGAGGSAGGGGCALPGGSTGGGFGGAGGASGGVFNLGGGGGGGGRIIINTASFSGTTPLIMGGSGGSDGSSGSGSSGGNGDYSTTNVGFIAGSYSSTTITGSGAGASVGLSSSASSGTFESATIDLGGKANLGNLDWTSTAAQSSIGTWSQTSDSDFNGTNSSTAVSGGSVGLATDANVIDFNKPTIAAYSTIAVAGLKNDGTVVNIGAGDTSGWTNIKAIAIGGSGTVGLKNDGTVACVNNGGYCPSITGWTNIRGITGGPGFVAGLKNDGTVVCAGTSCPSITGWTNIKIISGGGYDSGGSGANIIGLKNDGTVVCAGGTSSQCSTSSWTGIKAVATGGAGVSYGVKNDGTVVAVGPDYYGQNNVSSWTNIIAVGTRQRSGAALKSNGTVVAPGGGDYGWTNIKAISSGGYGMLGLKSDGTVVESGTSLGVSSWTNIKQPTYGYSFSGTYTSPIKPVGPGAGFGTMSWLATTASGQSVTMKVRSCNDSACSGETSFASLPNVTNGQDISSLTGVSDSDGYVQYQATLTTSDVTATPTLDSVSINITPLALQVATSDSSSGPWTYYGPDGATGTYFTSSGTAIPSTLSGKQYFRYKAYLATADTAYTPTLDSLTLNYTQYATSGTLTSSIYDTGSADRVVGNISWSADADAGRTVKFQVRSSSDATTWSDWCGPATTCTGSDYFTVNTGVSGGLPAGHPLVSGGNDRYFQYRAYLDSNSSATTPILTSVTVSYVGNAPPVVSNVVTAVGQNSDPSSGEYGKVSFSFDASDEDTELGSEATKNKVTPTLYEYYNGTAWVTICTPSSCSAGSLSGNAFSPISLATNSTVANTTVVWTPPAGIARTTGAKIRVTITDGEGANNSGTATMAGVFTLDTVAPTIVTANMDSSGTQDKVNLTATDDSTLVYRLCNAVCPSETWTGTAITSGTPTQIDWAATGAPNAETVYYQVRDLYGNVTANTITAPATPSGFLNADVSNPTAQSFGESLSWVAVPGATYYKVYSAYTASASTAPSSYTLLASPTTNIYAHTITTATTSAYWYKVAAVNTNGDISNFSALMTEGDVPDSFGTTLPDTAAPVISSLIATNIKNTSAEINFSTDELAIMQVFYGTGSCSTPTTITTSYVTGHSVYLTDLLPNTAYYYCARVTDVLGNVGAITPGAVTTFTTIGGPVITNVTERELTDVSALIFWNTSTSSDSKVYYSTTKASVNASTPVTGAAVTVAGTPNVYQHQIGLTGLASGSKYYYKVVSADALDPGISSTDDNNGQYYSFVTLKDTTPPTIMGTSTPVLASDAAVIVWQTDEMATTKVDYGTTPGVYTAKGVAEDSNFSIYHVTTLSSATANVRGAPGDKNTLVPETTYYYRVTSKDAANNSATSEGTFTTPKTGDVTIVAVSVVNRVVNPVDTVTPDTTAPTISNVKVSDITPFSAVVSFETSESSYATLKYGKDTSYGDASSDDVWGATHTIKLRGLTLGTDYHIKVTAHDKAGNTGTSDDQTFKTPFLSENLKDMTKIENIEQFQKEIEETIESILPSLVPPFVSKPSVTDITENGATVSFKTNIKAFPVVSFVEDGTYDTTKDNPYTGEVSDTENKATDHKVELTGLKQNTKYHLQARAFSLPKVIGKSADITFTTKASKISGSIIERKKDSFTVVWTTDESTTSIVEYKNLKTRITERKTDDVKRTAHSMKIDNLPPGTTYEVDISGINEQGNIVEAGATLTVTTSRDVTAPIISGFKVDNALVPGRTDRIQTIVSWKTDEAANSTVYYEEGAGTAGDTKELANKNEVLDAYITAHSVILPNLKPGTIYRLKVTSSDDSGNEASFGPRTVITPRQTESITDIIFKNFEDSFKFLRQM